MNHPSIPLIQDWVGGLQSSPKMSRLPSIQPPPAAPLGVPWGVPSGTCLEHLPRRHPDQMAEPPQPAPLNVEKQFYSELSSDDRASCPISEEAHFMSSSELKMDHGGSGDQQLTPKSHKPKWGGLPSCSPILEATSSRSGRSHPSNFDGWLRLSVNQLYLCTSHSTT